MRIFCIGAYDTLPQLRHDLHAVRRGEVALGFRRIHALEETSTSGAEIQFFTVKWMIE